MIWGGQKGLVEGEKKQVAILRGQQRKSKEQRDGVGVSRREHGLI